MILVQTITQSFQFDLEAERARIDKCFKGKQRARQLAILNACFEEKDIPKMKELYDKLPRCPKRECSEAEYVGISITIFAGDNCRLPAITNADLVVEIKDEEKPAKSNGLAKKPKKS
jgi:hypothetical protein